MSAGLQFSATCTCGGELSILTRCQPDLVTTSAHVVCRACGSQWVIDVFMNPVTQWSQEAARRESATWLRSIDAKGRLSV